MRWEPLAKLFLVFKLEHFVQGLTPTVAFLTFLVTVTEFDEN